MIDVEESFCWYDRQWSRMQRVDEPEGRVLAIVNVEDRAALGFADIECLIYQRWCGVSTHPLRAVDILRLLILRRYINKHDFSRFDELTDPQVDTPIDMTCGPIQTNRHYHNITCACIQKGRVTGVLEVDSLDRISPKYRSPDSRPRVAYERDRRNDNCYDPCSAAVV